MSKKYIIFGAGKVGQEAISSIGIDNILCVCDNDPLLHGTMIKGCKVVSFSEMKRIYQKDEHKIIVALGSISAVDTVEKLLTSEGIIFDNYFYDYELNETTEEIFSDIYLNNKWGKKDEEFYSGSGSHDDKIIRPYINMLRNFIVSNNISSILDIGCGDFWIMRQVLDNCGEIHYHGIDVVEKLVQYNKDTFGNKFISFTKMDVSKKEEVLPDAELVIVRQVLQHLDNESVKIILDKLSKFKYCLITEHLYMGKDVIYNLDKPMNSGIRLFKKSGIYLEQEPFNLKKVAHLLSVPESGGVIRTTLIIN